MYVDEREKTQTQAQYSKQDTGEAAQQQHQQGVSSQKKEEPLQTDKRRGEPESGEANNRNHKEKNINDKDKTSLGNGEEKDMTEESYSHALPHRVIPPKEPAEAMLDLTAYVTRLRDTCTCGHTNTTRGHVMLECVVEDWWPFPSSPSHQKGTDSSEPPQSQRVRSAASDGACVRTSDSTENEAKGQETKKAVASPPAKETLSSNACSPSSSSSSRSSSLPLSPFVLNTPSALSPRASVGWVGLRVEEGKRNLRVSQRLYVGGSSLYVAPFSVSQEDMSLQLVWVLEERGVVRVSNVEVRCEKEEEEEEKGGKQD